MARPNPASDLDHDLPNPDDWQALRGELVALLNQVEQQVGQDAPDSPGVAGLSERMRDLREQVAGAVPASRRRDALRSVQKAVERMTEREDSAVAEPNPRQALQTAIDEIRSRQANRGAPKAAAPKPAAPRLEPAAAIETPATPAPKPAPAATAGLSEAAQRLAQAERDAAAAREALAREQEVARLAAEAEARAQAAREELARREAAEREAAERAAAQREAAAVEAARQAEARERAAREAAAREAAAREAAAQREALALQQAEREAEARAHAARDRLDREEAARQLVRSEIARAVPAVPDFSPKFDELATAVGSLTGRLERLEGEIKTQAGTGTVQEVAEQVAQLSHVVEALAAAVGETGQVKRLETQIAGLAKMLVNNQKGDHVDMVALTQRLDDVSATVERLADLQVQQAGREKDLPAQQVALRNGIQVVEKTVRSVYDRIDAIEKNYALTPADFEKLQTEMARFAEAIEGASDQPQHFANLVEALHTRIATIESRDSEVAALKDDILTLRDAVLGSVEPRFAAMEVQLEALNERMAARQPDIPGVTLIEAQVRQLVARMDQTGSQLSTLAKLYAESEERDASIDYEALADLVMNKTEEALARLEPPAPIDIDALADLVASRTEQRIAPLASGASVAAAAGLDESGLDELEERMARVFRSASAERGTADLADMQSGIRKVDERLERLEEMLDRLGSSRPLTGPLHSADPLPPRDSMPIAPAVDRPLVERPFGDPVPSAFDPGTGLRKRHPGLEADDPPSFSELSPLTPSMLGGVTPASDRGPDFGFGFEPPSFDPASIDRPPRPESAFDSPDADVFTASPPPAPEAATPAPSSSSRNTFMEAQRRAMQRHQGAPPASGNSLLSRALARFQNKPVDEVRLPTETPVAEAPPLDRKARKALKAQAAAAVTAPVTPEVEVPEAAVDPVAVPEVRESFLSRHRQPILLALSVVALSFLTLNLINQRMSGEQDTVPEPGALVTQPETATAPASNVSGLVLPVAPVPSVTGPALETAPLAQVAETIAPRVVTMVDSLATGSIDPAASSFMPTAAQPIPDAFVAPAAAIVPPLGSDADTVVELDPTTTAAIAPLQNVSPVQVELPPEALGPLELRQAAANGDPRAQFEIAAIYTEGRAVPQDLAAAAMWYERAAAQGFVPAQYRLGNLYENGRGAEKDLEQARLWYQRAAEAGNRMSMHNLAALYAGGELGDQDFASAARWFEEAANQGMTDSQFNLGMLYARGLGVPQDLEASFKWFSLASLSGDVDAAKSRDDVAKSLTAEQVAKISDEVATWKAGPINLASNFAPIGTWSPTFDAGPVIDKTEVVVGVQTLLNRLGYDVGTADGFAGPRTAEAIRAFERATGMSETGQINPRLLAVLSSQPV